MQTRVSSIAAHRRSHDCPVRRELPSSGMGRWGVGAATLSIGFLTACTDATQIPQHYVVMEAQAAANEQARASSPAESTAASADANPVAANPDAAAAGTERQPDASSANKDLSLTGESSSSGRADVTSPPPTPASPPATAIKSEDASRIRESTFDDLKFDMQTGATFKRTMLTPQIEQLFGRRIRIRGYILPALRSKGLKQFVLVRDNMECCFGPGAALYDCILVTMAAGKGIEYTIRPVAVEGVLEFSEHAIAGETLAIYAMRGETVQ